MGLFVVDPNLRNAGQRLQHHGCLRSDVVRARMGAMVSDIDDDAHGLLHPMHAAGLQDPVYVVEVESGIEVRASSFPFETQRRSIDVLIFDLDVADAGDGGQHFGCFLPDHIAFGRCR